MQTVLDIQNISKKYTIRHSTGGYLSLRESLVNLLSFKSSETEEFWALNDVSFSVQSGESVGIIGRNGAGKSTLLKILSRITPPTKGRIVTRGRIASLLEVGTGFHPELTGRENIFFNGSLLGMKRREIENKFDEIVDFSGTEKFLDTPLKHYSSGMQLRLAFSVAAFLEPEILVVDEVLAVGDAEFQKKCLGKMEHISRNEGRTVLFVSHNIAALMQFCTRGIFLNRGSMISDGPIAKIVDEYLKTTNKEVMLFQRETGNGVNQFQKIHMTDLSGNGVITEYRFDEPFLIRVEMSLPKFHQDFELALRLIDRFKQPVFTIHEKLSGHYSGNQHVKLLLKIPANFLVPGTYSWVACINHPGSTMYDLQEDIVNFSILETGSDFARYNGVDFGRVFASYEAQSIHHD
jgi:lipopolysaccharide transport system ATP-binding protein